MQEGLTLTWHAVLLGAGATLVMDIWAFLQKQLFTTPSLDYRLVGRWLVHMLRGVFCHHTILQTPPVKGERLLGWIIHYLTGIIFAAVLLSVAGQTWLAAPTLLPALLTGILSIAAPFFVMQPAFGFGIAASKTPKPWVARWRSLVAHTVFGLGIWLSAALFAI